MISFPLSLVFTSNASTSTFNKYRLISALLIGTLSENREKNHVKILRLSKSLVFMLALPAKSRLYPRHCNVPNSNHIPSHQPVELNSVGAMNATISLSFTVTLSTNREKRERARGEPRFEVAACPVPVLYSYFDITGLSVGSPYQLSIPYTQF